MESLEFRTIISSKYTSESALEKLEEHLRNFGMDKRIALQAFNFDAENDLAERISFAVECGESQTKSVFLFHRGTSSSFEISGICSRNDIGDLKRDWKCLKARIDEANLACKEKNTKIILNSEILEKVNLSSYMKRKENLAFLVSISGISSAFSAILTQTLSWILPAQIVVGFVIWIIIMALGCHWEGDYVLR